MKLSIEIRPQRPDHPQVRALLDSLDDYLASLYEPDANHILDLQALLAPEVHFLVAWQGETALGCGAYRRMAGEADTAGQAYGEIKRMVVRPPARGQGIAQRLLSALEAAQLDAGLRLSLLETGGEQRAAVRLYERCGYRRRAPFGGYPDNGLSLFYGKVLRP